MATGTQAHPGEGATTGPLRGASRRDLRFFLWSRFLRVPHIWQRIGSNIYTFRRRKRLTEDEIMVCCCRRGGQHT